MRDADSNASLAVEKPSIDGDGRTAGSRGHDSRGERRGRGDAAPCLNVVLNDLRLQGADLRLEAGGDALQLADIHRIGLADAWGDVGDAPLAAGRADRDGIGHVRD